MQLFLGTCWVYHFINTLCVSLCLFAYPTGFFLCVLQTQSATVTLLANLPIIENVSTTLSLNISIMYVRTEHRESGLLFQLK